MTPTPSFFRIILALFFVWLGLKLIEHMAPQWAGWYIALIAFSIILYYRQQMLAVLGQVQGQLGGTASAGTGSTGR